MTAFVDCRALAARLIEQRKPWEPDIAEALTARFGIDATQTLAALEGLDAERARDWGDLPKLHALYHVPLDRFASADVLLMVVYGQAPQIMLALARLMLEHDPVMKAEHHAGDLLLHTAYLVAFNGLDAPCGVNGQVESLDTVWVHERIAAAEERLWQTFEARAEAQGIAADEANAVRQRIRNGPPMQASDWGYDLDNLMQVIAEARAWVDPPRILLRARHLRPVSPWRLPVPSHDETSPGWMLDRASNDDTVFEIAARRSRRGVRIVSPTPSAMRGWRGTVFEAVESAQDFAQRELGISRTDWHTPHDVEVIGFASA